MRIKSILAVPLLLAALPVWSQDAPIIRDAEYKILEVQNGEAWASDDQEIASKLAKLREKNGGKPPNIVYILLDDVGFGEISMDELSVIRGYKTPNMTAMANDGLSMMRMYTEPSCTPTRVAMMTGRYPIRTGTTEAKATLAGDGLAGDEVQSPKFFATPAIIRLMLANGTWVTLKRPMRAIRVSCTPNFRSTSRASWQLWAGIWKILTSSVA